MADKEKNPWRSVDASGHDWNSGEDFDPTPAQSSNAQAAQPQQEPQAAASAQAAPAVQQTPQASPQPSQTPVTRSVPQASDSAALSQQAARTVQNNRMSHADTGTFRGYLDDWLSNARQQSEERISRGVTTGVNELARVQEEAKEQYQTQRDQITADEKRALDNQALYMAMNGMAGSGVGMEQYNSIQNAAMQARVKVNSAQTKLANDTARQMAELRANGEFEKAQALLQLNQEYISQLSSLERWAMQYNASVDQFNASLDQWLASYNFQLRQMDLSQYQWEQSFAYQKERDAVSDNQWERTFAANRSDAAWQQGMAERQYADSRSDTKWQQGMAERQYADSRSDTAWQQGMTERQYADSRSDTRWQQGMAERQYADSRSDTRWQQGMTERQYADSRSDTRWQQGITERQYADSRSDTAWQQGVTEKQLAASQLSNLQQYVMTALSNGYMVDDATLEEAEIDKNYASLIVSNARNAAALETEKAAAELENKQADTVNKQASASKALSELGKAQKPPLTAEQVQEELSIGNLAPNVLSAYEYYYGESYLYRHRPDLFDVTSIKSSKDAVDALTRYGYGDAVSGLMEVKEWTNQKWHPTEEQKKAPGREIFEFGNYQEYLRAYVYAALNNRLKGDVEA